MPDSASDACGSGCWAYGLCQHGTLPTGECRCVECTDGWDDFSDAQDATDDGDRPPHECPPVGDDDACVTPGLDEGLGVLQTVPGDCWCVRPEVTDLSPDWYKPSEACEQVTYLDFLYMGEPTNWDVWDGEVVSSARPGVQVWHVASQSVELIAANDPDGALTRRTRISSWGITYSVLWDCASLVVSYEMSTQRKRLLFFRPDRLNDDGMCDQSEYRDCWDIFGSTAPVRRSESADGSCSYRLTVVDALTGAETELGPAAGLCLWDGDLWDRQVVLSYGFGSGLGVIDLGEPEAIRALAPSSGCQWSASLHEASACWMDTRDGSGCPVDGWTGSRIYCSDLTGTPTSISSGDEEWEPASPDVFGEWVAYHTESGSYIIAPFEVWLYHRGKGLRFRLADAATGLPEPTYTGWQGYGYPRVWGDYVYFQADGLDATRRAGNVYRCDLRRLFPEAYE